MAASNPTFAYHLFGIYVIELGKFFREKFSGFKVNSTEDPLNCQVFFGTPRAAFRYYFDKFNGKINLPMVNYHLIDVERKPEFEPTSVYLTLRDTYDITQGTSSMMRAPGVFELTYSINLFCNSYRERDYMMHAMFNAFPKGELHLIHLPDYANYPDVFLEMPHKMELAVNDETELEGLDQAEVRDMIRTNMTIRCTRAFVPYDAFDVPVVSYIEFSGIMNDIIHGFEDQETYFKLFQTTHDIVKIGITIPETTITIT